MAHDLSSLQSKIAGALDDDQKKKQVNDAKLRAVSQKSDYDVFCNLVAGAHLKPVKPRAAESVRAAPPTLRQSARASLATWLPPQAAISRPFEGFVMPALSAEEKASGPSGGPACARSAEPPTLAPPRNANEFTRTWRRACTTPAARLAYLRLIDPSALGGLFRAEIDSSVLDGIAGALHLGLVRRESDVEASAAPRRGVA